MRAGTDVVYGVFAQVSGSPDTSQLPGGQVLQDLTDGVMGFALVACLIALFISAGAWALGANSQNYQYTSAGKRGVLFSGLAALVIGAGPAIINFFFTAGGAT